MQSAIVKNQSSIPWWPAIGIGVLILASITLLHLQERRYATWHHREIFKTLEIMAAAVEDKVRHPVNMLEMQAFLRDLTRTTGMPALVLRAVQGGTVQTGESLTQAPRVPLSEMLSDSIWQGRGLVAVVIPIGRPGVGAAGSELTVGISLDAYHARRVEAVRDIYLWPMSLIVLLCCALWMLSRPSVNNLYEIFAFLRKLTRHNASDARHLLSYAERAVTTTNAELQTAREQARMHEYLWQGITQVAIFVLNRQGRVVDVNEGAVTMLDYTREQLLGRELVSFWGKESGYNDLWQRVLARAGQNILNAEDIFLVSRQGISIKVNMAVVPRKDASGMDIGFVASAFSLAHREQMIEFWRRRWNDVSAQLRVKSIDLDFFVRHCEDLRQRHAEQIARLSYELRAPANTILGYGQLLHEDKHLPIASYQRRSVQEIVSAGGQLLNCLTEVLSQSDRYAPGVSAGLESVALAPLARECAASVDGVVRYRDVRVQCVCRIEDDAVVSAHRERLAHCLINILLGVTGRARAGSVIELAVEAFDQRLNICLTTDLPSGPEFGLNGESDANENFEKEFLAIKAQLELMAGRLEVTRSVAGQCGLVISLARAFETVESNTSAQRAMPSRQIAQPMVERVVLYIEDNDANLRLVENILQRHAGVKVLGASEPWQGLAMAHAHQPDLILVDINLPGIDGYQVLQQLKQYQLRSNPSIFAVSANAADGEVDRGLAAGFERYFTKPINVRQFIDEISSTLVARQEPVGNARDANTV